MRGARDRNHGHHAVRRGRPAPTGTVVDTRTYAPIHQHFLVARLDLDVDGAENTVVEATPSPPPIGADNPYGLALAPRPPIAAESEGTGLQLGHPARLEGRATHQAQPHGTPPAYKLAPGAAFPALLDRRPPVYRGRR